MKRIAQPSVCLVNRWQTQGDRIIISHGWARGDEFMPSFRDADLAAIKARYESNYALITNDPKIANDPVIIAALAKAKASEAAFYAALENVEAKSNLLRRWGAFRRFRQAAIAAEKAHDKLRAAVKAA